MKRAYILVAEGFECIETLAPIDVMQRAGVELRRVAVGGSLDVTSSHGLVTLRCDELIEDADLSDGAALILPGGYPGYVNLRTSEAVCRAVRDYYDSGRLVAAICGAPTVLPAAGVAHNRRVTCHSSVVEEMHSYTYLKKDVVEDDNLITAAGAGLSVDFTLAVASRLVDSEILSRVCTGMEL